MALTKTITGESATDQTHLLLNASVLVFLFRAIAGARTIDKGEEVAKQLLSPLGAFVVFESRLAAVCARHPERHCRPGRGCHRKRPRSGAGP
jgi:hypothetical protein